MLSKRLERITMPKPRLIEGERFAPFKGRRNLGTFLKSRGLNGKAVEIGTHRGIFASQLLDRSSLERLYCIDPYVGGYDKEDPVSFGDRNNDLRLAERRLEKFGSRVSIIIQESLHAVELFEDSSLDFAYVDGCHQPKYVDSDLRAWWEKIRKGGILAGHDIICPHARSKGGLGWGKYVRPIVHQFAREKRKTIYIVRDSHSYWSYYLEK